MSENKEAISIKNAVHKLQLSLLEGIKSEEQLSAAGALISQNDYKDVVVERSITNLCGFPLCHNSLPTNRQRKGNYRISLKEHKVYDLHETYMYCCSDCVVKSRVFLGSLSDERCGVEDFEKVKKILRFFEGFEENEGLGKNGDLGFGNLRIEEKSLNGVGDVCFEEFVGPFNAIEGYVPLRDRNSDSLAMNDCNEGSKLFLWSKLTSDEKNGKQEVFFSDADFMSAIINQDEYSISKTPSAQTSIVSDTKVGKEKKGEGIQKKFKAKSSDSLRKDTDKVLGKLREDMSNLSVKDEPSSFSQPSSSSSVSFSETGEKQNGDRSAKLGVFTLKSSLKSSKSKRDSRSVTWADAKVDSAGRGYLCEVREMDNAKVQIETSGSGETEVDGSSLHFESAEACATALSQAAEAVASGSVDVGEAMSEAGFIILPRPHYSDHGDSLDDTVMADQVSNPLKWPSKPGIPKSEFFDPEDSWYDEPPEGFSLALSPFATMWMALFAWVSSSSLAYIYGRDEGSYEDYSSVNGREYPRKIVLREGRSLEIKQTVEGCFSRALPGLVADLRLPIPLSTLEKGVALLLDSMSFVDAVPAFRMKEWQTIALLFLEALSVCRIPALTSHMTSRRAMLHKVLDVALITTEEYETMRDLMMPLGRAPHFSAQSGA